MRPLAIAALAIFSGGSSFAAISASTIWEIRTTGNANNGGGFVSGASGTDFSQQNAAQVAYTDMVLGAGGTSYTSALNPVVAADVGNLVQVISGVNCTTGFYQITSQAAGVAQLDRSAGTAASTCTSNLGGALTTVGTAVTNSVSGNIFYIRASGTYTITSTITFPNTFLGAQFIGYTTVRTDNGQATITTATNTTPIFTRANNQGAVAFVNLIMSNSAGTRAAAYNIASGNNNDQRIIFDNCVLDGVSTAVSNTNFEFWDPLVIQNTEIKNTTLDAIRTTINTQYMIFIENSYIHANTGAGLFMGTGSQPTSQSSLTVENSIFKGNSYGLELQVPNGLGLSVLNSAFISNTNDGIFLNPGTGAGNEIYGQISNNVLLNNGGFGINVNAGTGGGFYLRLRSNAYFGNTSGQTGNINLTSGALVPTVTTGLVTMTGDPFVNNAGNNFALNNTASAGAACRGAGFPGALQIGGTGFIDIGPLQHQATGGGATGAPIIQ